MMIAQSFMTANTMQDDTIDYGNNDNSYTGNKSFNYATDILMVMVMITMMGIMMMMTTRTMMMIMLMMIPHLVVKKTLPPTILT